MFSSLGLLNRYDCPEQARCSLSNCLFAHHILDTRSAYADQANEPTKPRKRQRLNDNGDSVRVADPTATGVSIQHVLVAPQPKAIIEPLHPRLADLRPISPPPLRKPKTQIGDSVSVLNGQSNPIATDSNPKTNGAVEPKKPAELITLNPNILPNPPASHAIRMQLLKMIHDEMVRLNELLCPTNDPAMFPLRISPPGLVKEAIDEEEKMATQNQAVYANVIKLRIVRLRKMKAAEWKDERLKQIARSAPIEIQLNPTCAPKSINTGLSPAEEIAFLAKIFAKQDILAKHGYVPSAPTALELERARQGVEAAQGWEQCDRCKTRFQVFPGRREEDGALTSGGQCCYHPAKPRRPQAKDKANGASKDVIFACCNENVGRSSGCTKSTTHVFKISDPKRLELIMPFVETPPKLLAPGPNRAVCFDCEMGYTTKGLELIRLTATSWPYEEALLDVLVRPIGEVLDLNSAFSGVFPKDYEESIPYDSRFDGNTKIPGDDAKPKPRLVDSPAKARDLLFELLTPETPLIGHALDNDLNATRVIHPSIVDSVLLYPHPRGLPIRFGLKMLMKKHLDRDIQTGGAHGHDSKEDAQAAGDLVRLKVADMWKAMKRDGWIVRDGEFLPPSA